MKMLLLALAILAQDGPPPRGPGGAPPRPGVVKPASGERIAWYGTLAQAREEAKRTGRPIMLLAAAPHCHNVSGIW